MRLLVTRPEPDATATAAKLRALGHEVIVAPLLSIVFAPPPPEIPEPAAIILTSRNGVRALTLWPQAARWRDRPLFVTGEATAEAARRAGFADVRAAARDAAHLGSFLMSEIGTDVRPILYPAARDRAGALSGGLSARGYDIRTIEAYRAETSATLDPAAGEALRSGAVGGVLVYSHRTAVAFRALVEKERVVEGLRGTTLFALSERVAEPLRGLGAGIAVAGRPDEESLIALLPGADR